MLKLCEASNGCSFYFLASFNKKFASAVFAFKMHNQAKF